MSGSAGSIKLLAASPAVSTTAAGTAQLGIPPVPAAGGRRSSTLLREVWLLRDNASPAFTAMQWLSMAFPAFPFEAATGCGEDLLGKSAAPGLVPGGAALSQRRCAEAAMAGRCCCEGGAHTTVTRSPALAGTSAVEVPTLRQQQQQCGARRSGCQRPAQPVQCGQYSRGQANVTRLCRTPGTSLPASLRSQPTNTQTDQSTSGRKPPALPAPLLPT